MEGKDQMPYGLTRIMRVTEFPTFVLFYNEVNILFWGWGEVGLEGVMRVMGGVSRLDDRIGHPMSR